MIGLGVGAFVPVVPLAQQTVSRLARVGLLFTLSQSLNKTRVEAFKQGLRERGYFENKNVVFEHREADGDPAKLPRLAAELVQLKVDVIVTAGPSVTAAAKNATISVPIVMAWDEDPVGNGFVKSLAKPGGNVTGLSSVSAEISGKRLELLREIVPTLSRVAVVGDLTQPGNKQGLAETRTAAKTLGVELQYMNAQTLDDVERIFKSASMERADAMLVQANRAFYAQRDRVIALAAKNRLPTMYAQLEFVESGGLIAYASNVSDMYRRAAYYVDRILKGAKPADLPVEQPTTFDLMLNMKTAKALGLTIPQSIMVRATRVIE